MMAATENEQDKVLIDALQDDLASKPLEDDERRNLVNAIDMHLRPCLIGSHITAPRDRRKRMDGLLKSWGQWMTDGSQALGFGKSLGSVIQTGAEVGSGGDGYDHAGLSDHDSNMILINQVVESLNPIDKDLIRFEFVTYEQDRMRMWAEKYQLTTNRYKSKKSELLLDLSFRVRIKMA